ncbi:MAG: hypothetical protein QXI35_07265 [Candidatus Nezhaarchaeales archaeon]
MRREQALAPILVALALFASATYVLNLPQPELDGTSLAVSYWHKYIMESYRPEPISPAEIGEHPSEHFIKDVPWISYRRSYCASTCLQMIAYKYGVAESIGYFNFITCFTYGAYLGTMGGMLFFIPGSDPIAGLARASEYLGFKYRMLVTADKDLFLKAVRYLIHRDLPVILPVNASRLYGGGLFSPHFVLAVGYSGDEVYVYEPVMDVEGIRYGERGIPIDAETLARAVMEMIGGMGYPVAWSYALIYYAPKGEIGKDLREALRDCAELQVGMKFGGATFAVFMGAQAFEALAKAIEDGKISLEMANVGLHMAIASRRDNAAFLKSAFLGEPKVLEAASMLEKAASIYEEAIETLKMGYTIEVRGKVAEKLREAASYEREAGRLLASFAG